MKFNFTFTVFTFILICLSGCSYLFNNPFDEYRYQNQTIRENAPAFEKITITNDNDVSPDHFCTFRNTLYFTAASQAYGREIMKLNTQGKPVIVFDLLSGTGSFDPADLTVFNDRLYFTAQTAVNGREIYEFNGSDLNVITNIPDSDSVIRHLKVFDNQLYFMVQYPSKDAEIWTVSSAGSANLKYTLGSNPGTGSAVSGFTLYSGELYFRANDPAFGIELFRCSATQTPVRISDLNADSGDALPSSMTVFNSRLYFSAFTPFHGIELWSYDRNENQFNEIQDINQTGSAGSNPSGLTVYNNQLIFSADDGSNGIEMWIYSGSGLCRLIDIAPQHYSSQPRSWKSYRGILFFSGQDETQGHELWHYRGSGLPKLYKDIDTDGYSDPANFYVFNGSLYFSAHGDTNLFELYRLYLP